MRSFGEIFTFEQYQALQVEKTTPEAYQKLFRETFTPAFSTFFYELAEAGRITKLPTYGREVTTIDRWNLALSKGERYERALADIAFIFHSPLSMSKHEAKNDMQAGYELFIEEMDNGNFPFLMRDSYDFVTGTNFQLKIENWNLMFYTYGERLATGCYEHIPITTLALEPIVTAEVEFESGEILVADWFRIKSFTDIVEPEDRFSINNIEGRRLQALHYASQGFISVVLGNCSPSLWKRGDTYIIGRHEDCDEEMNDGLVHDYITTDLWATTMIDRAKLEEMVGVEVVAEYLKDNDVKTFQVEPGKYKLTFAPDYNKFAEAYKPTVDITGIEPFFVVEKM